MTTEQHLTASLPLTAGSGFADSLYDSQMSLGYISASTILEQEIATALANGDTEKANKIASALMSINEDVFSLSFEA